jgi:hypothetical protein
MEMFLMAAVMSLLAVAVSAALFAAATRDERSGAPNPDERLALEQRRFFASAPTPRAASSHPAAEQQAAATEALLLQIEEHIRLEQAAAESFLHMPTGASLHSRTTSRLVN